MTVLMTAVALCSSSVFHAGGQGLSEHLPERGVGWSRTI